MSTLEIYLVTLVLLQRIDKLYIILSDLENMEFKLICCLQNDFLPTLLFTFVRNKLPVHDFSITTSRKGLSEVC